MHILIVEDDMSIADILKQGFTEEHYNVNIASTAEEGLYLATKKSYDVIVLDWMLPQMDGITLCQMLRQKHITTPILLLTAKHEVHDKVLGLNCGADDFLSKPFAFDELFARVNALIRRDAYKVSSEIVIEDLIFNTEKREVTRGGTLISLTGKEYDILELLIKNKGHIITTEKLALKFWGTSTIESNVINVFAHHLRSKIDKTGMKKLIKTVRGLGFKINED